MPNPPKKYYKKPWYNNAKSNSQKKIEAQHFQVSPCYGYFGFQLYFMEKDTEIDTLLKNVTSFESYIYRNITQFPLPKIKENLAFNVDLKQLLSEYELNKEWDNFKDEIIEKTEYCLSCFGLAMHQTIFTELIKKCVDEDGVDHSSIIYDTLRIIRCRLLNHEPIVGIKNLRVNTYGKLISVKGTVIKRGTTKLLCRYMAFSCSSCSGSQALKQIDGIFTAPVKCNTKGCRAFSNFIPLLSSPHTRTISCQTLKLQELVGEDSEDIGRVPRSIECELTEDLVGHCVPGDDVTITGIVKVRHTNEVCGKNKQPSIFLLYVDAVSIINDKNHSNPGIHPGITFNQTDCYAIQKIHSEPGLFRFLVQSLCPSIYGHEVVKAGLLLALFGGTKSQATIRSDSHVLIVGDPGLGKSQLLQACSNIAPRGVYVCGNTSTSAGLTVTMTREGGGDYSLEAGALMLADQGCCCIDEFDKMTGQHDCLLEVMEQQNISISKAGVSYNLPTRASILAAANPVGGHYNKAKTVAENLKMGSPLLSRFDLVFILLDKPNEQLDLLLSEHVLALHSGRKKISSTVSESSMQSQTNSQITHDLKDRLKILVGENLDHLPHVLLRKYIAYAQKYVHPMLNREAQKVLKQFYLDLRKRHHSSDSTPVTTRQLESLQRLTQARAKLELREEATADDAADVVEIMTHSLVDIFTDDLGSLDFTRSQNGSGVSNRKIITKFLKALQHKSDVIGRTMFTKKELKELSDQMGVGPYNFNGVLDSMNIQGFLIKKSGDNFQLYTGS